MSRSTLAPIIAQFSKTRRVKGTVVELTGDTATVQVAGYSNRANIRVIGGPVEIGDIVNIEWNGFEPVVFAHGKSSVSVSGSDGVATQSIPSQIPQTGAWEVGNWSVSESGVISHDNGNYRIDPTKPSLEMGDATGFMTGTGIWQGKDAGVYKMHIGNPGGQYMKWDGTDLVITGHYEGIIDGTTADVFTINSDQDDVNVDLVFGRTTGGDATIRWNGTVVTIDKPLGATTIDGTTIVNGTFTVNNTAVFNEGSGDYDFRIESNGQEYMFFVDAGNDTIGVKGNAPFYDFDVVGAVRATTFSVGTGDPTNVEISKGASGQLILESSVGLYSNDKLLLSDSAWETPGGRLHIRQSSTPQLVVAYDATNYSNLYTTSGGNFTMSPTGDIYLDPNSGLPTVFPSQGYTVNLGSLSNKYLSLFAAELWVETLVAHETIATIGGRILVGPTTELTEDIDDTQTTIYVKHNEMAAGDHVYMEGQGKFEAMTVVSGPTGTGPYAYVVTRNVDLSGASAWDAGSAVFNTGVNGEGFIDIYSYHAINAGTTYGPTIVGNVRYSTGYADYAPYWAIGNLSGLYGKSSYGIGLGHYSQANYLTITTTDGIQFFDSNDTQLAQLTGTTWTLGALADAHVTLTSTAFSINDANDYQRLLANGSGIYLSDGSNVMVEINNSGDVIIGNNEATSGNYIHLTPSVLTFNKYISGAFRALITLDASGNATFGRTDGTNGNMFWDVGSGQLKFRSGGTTAAYIDTAGTMWAASGTVYLNSSGITINVGTGTSNKFKFYDSAASNYVFQIQSVTQSSQNQTDIIATYPAIGGRSASIIMMPYYNTIRMPDVSLQVKGTLTTGWDQISPSGGYLTIYRDSTPVQLTEFTSYSMLELQQNSDSGKYLRIGYQDANWCSLYTSAGNFFMNKHLNVDGDIIQYAKGWQSFSLTEGGWSSVPTLYLRYKKIGRMVYVTWYIEGTADAANTWIYLPETPMNEWHIYGTYFLNNGGSYSIGTCRVNYSNQQLEFFTGSGGSLVASGTKGVYGNIMYQASS